MKNFKSHFWYNKSQRNGIFFLVIIIIIFQLIYFFVDFSSKEKTDLNSAEIIKFQQEIDSLKAIELARRKTKIFPFNPSFISDFKGYRLGMTVLEIDRLLSHRKAGNYINSAEEFQQVTKVSDSLLATISPYFKFPDWIKNNQLKTVKSIKKNNNSTDYIIRDINSVTAEELTKINGVGTTLAQRIIAYRTKLKGFIINEQLYEVYYLDRAIADKILEQFKVIEQPLIKKININDASFKEVLAIVYIDYKLTKKIFDYRDEVAEVQSIQELKKIEGFPLEKFNRIALYLDVK